MRSTRAPRANLAVATTPRPSPGFPGTRVTFTPSSRGLHSSNFRLNVSAFCGIGDVCRGRSRGVDQGFRSCQGVLGGV
jgi:hypothetical protein